MKFSDHAANACYEYVHLAYNQVLNISFVTRDCRIIILVLYSAKFQHIITSHTCILSGGITVNFYICRVWPLQWNDGYFATQRLRLSLSNKLLRFPVNEEREDKRGNHATKSHRHLTVMRKLTRLLKRPKKISQKVVIK